MTISSHAGRDTAGWSLALPVILLLCGHVFFSAVESGYAQFLRLGEHFWEDYYQLRNPVIMPDCGHIDVETPLFEQREPTEDDELFDELLGANPTDEALYESLRSQQALCMGLREQLGLLQDQATWEVEWFRAFDHFLLTVAHFGRDRQREVLCLLIFFCAVNATVRSAHIRFRPPHNSVDYRVAAFGELAANLLLCLSAFYYLNSSGYTTIDTQRSEVRWLYLAGFSSLALSSMVQLFQTRTGLPQAGSVLKAILCIPLYCYIALVATLFHLLVRGDPQGVVLYFDKIMDFAGIFANIAVYIWVGMMLGRSSVGSRVFDVVRPWRLPPEIMGVIVILLVSIPTAYTGASGVIIIALGGMIYRELRLSGARRQLAIATTALAGSSGVVLRPCLLIVLIAALNRDVTTEQMFGWGGWILVLTACLYFLVASSVRQSSPRVASVNHALKPSMASLIRLLPYGLVFYLVVELFRIVLGIGLDEFSVVIIMPATVMALLFFEKVASPYLEQIAPNVFPRSIARRITGYGGMAGPPASPEAMDASPASFGQSVRASAEDCMLHIGALLMLMAMSVVLGGAIEESGLVYRLADPAVFDPGVGLTATLLLLVLVLLGMCMDPFGAVILVSGTLAPVAIQQGIDPLHFWMISLVAFELGYLSPPVAVNQLLTRWAIGEQEFMRAREVESGGCFWARYEHVLLPLTILGLVLLVVTYLPLLLQGSR